MILLELVLIISATYCIASFLYVNLDYYFNFRKKVGTAFWAEDCFSLDVIASTAPLSLPIYLWNKKKLHVFADVFHHDEDCKCDKCVWLKESK